MAFTIKVNGTARSVDADGDTPLLWVLRDEAPAIEVHIVKSSEPPGGMGETETSTIVQAINNVIFAATGKRLRKMPVDSGLLKQPTWAPRGIE